MRKAATITSWRGREVMPAVGGDETTPLRREDGESAIYQRLYILRRGREAGRRSGQGKQAAEHLLCHGLRVVS